jgi:hypothetical protein
MVRVRLALQPVWLQCVDGVYKGNGKRRGAVRIGRPREMPLVTRMAALQLEQRCETQWHSSRVQNSVYTSTYTISVLQLLFEQLRPSCSVWTEFTVPPTGKRQWTPERNATDHTHARASSEQALGTNGILECKFMSKARTPYPHCSRACIARGGGLADREGRGPYPHCSRACIERDRNIFGLQWCDVNSV